MATDTKVKIPAWAIRKPLTQADTIAKLNDMASAAYSCARTTTEPAVREGYMDRCHALREAARHLSR